MPKSPIPAAGGAMSAEASTSDPVVFAAIERWKKAKAALTAAGDAEEAFGASGSKDAVLERKLARAEEHSRRAYQEYAAACLKVYGTIPHTAAGLLAILAVWKAERADDAEAEPEETELLVATVEAFVKGATTRAMPPGS